MKQIPFLKIFVVVPISLMIYFSSCGPSAKEYEEKYVADSIRSADSLAMVNAEQQRIADSIAKAQMPHFPWPPPKASASVKIPRELFVKPNQKMTLSQVGQEFESAMNKAGYTSLSYFYVPSGFAIVSQLEQINPDGTPKKKERWSVQYQQSEINDFASYIKALFIAMPGYFRVIAFIFTTQPYKQTNKEMPKDTAASLIHAGLDNLPPKIEAVPYSENFKCNALIYEFEQKSINSKAVLKDPSSVNGKEHLVKAKIWGELAK
jgi:hypothetical protein